MCPPNVLKFRSKDNKTGQWIQMQHSHLRFRRVNIIGLENQRAYHAWKSKAKQPYVIYRQALVKIITLSLNHQVKDYMVLFSGPKTEAQ